MTYDGTGLIGLNYDLCGYEGSRLYFRGPKVDLRDGYVAFLGATETFGKFVEQPFPALLNTQLPVKTVNLGLINAGLDAYLADPEILTLARNANLRVVQVMGALNQSNHYFKVHPRRNDRFIAASDALIGMFPDVNFSEFHYTRALLTELHKRSTKRYSMICKELQKVWLQRMNQLLDAIGDDTVFLWCSMSRPAQNAHEDPFDPLLVDVEMVQKIRLRARCYVEFVPGPVARKADRTALLDMMVSPAAIDLILGPNAHKQAAQALQESCLHLLKHKTAHAKRRPFE